MFSLGTKMSHKIINHVSCPIHTISTKLCEITW
uniref:Uncharacterized protein n=1 Tax=Arundo donax TaxID=35708 RepID=A0A0A9HT33_ARUDO